MSFLSSERELYGERPYGLHFVLCNCRGNQHMFLPTGMLLAFYAFSKRESSNIDSGTTNASSNVHFTYMNDTKVEQSFPPTIINI